MLVVFMVFGYWFVFSVVSLVFVRIEFVVGLVLLSNFILVVIVVVVFVWLLVIIFIVMLVLW